MMIVIMIAIIRIVVIGALQVVRQVRVYSQQVKRNIPILIKGYRAPQSPLSGQVSDRRIMVPSKTDGC